MLLGVPVVWKLCGHPDSVLQCCLSATTQPVNYPTAGASFIMCLTFAFSRDVL